ncbi:MAG: translational GTPase TypA [Candidatus Berkelbacteria bacterium]|nr:translational GTPase TypA [Candidatus Berkelbacteria bacterium]
MIRNVAIIAHVDHGKTTLVDGLLKQSKTFRDNEAEMGQTLIMDSNDQERERGITILAKNTAVEYNGVKINIIDTPGHADFGGEVERTLNMADGAILVIDAQEGPMPQTKFVLKKALEIGLKIIVVINKIDKKNARVDEVIERTSDLFLDLAHHESHLDFPTFYSIAKQGKAWSKMPENFDEPADLSDIFEAIIKYVPEPKSDPDGPFQMLVSALDWDSYQGKYAIGKISRGKARQGLSVALICDNGVLENTKIDKVFISVGLKRVEDKEARSGDIVAITGIKNAGIGDTIADAQNPEPLPRIKIEEPTLSMAVSANTSPFAGREGQFVTGRQILERIKKELETNVSLKLKINDQGEYILSGRGELHLSVFIENLRREGFELQIGKPEVITKTVDGEVQEPVEELTIDVEDNFANNVIAEVIKRKGTLHSQMPLHDGSTRLVFEITTRGLLGLRNQLLTLSRGTAVASSLFLRFEKIGSAIARLRNGVLIAAEDGKAVVYGLDIAQGRGITFIEPQTQVYHGMIIGLNSKESDIEINVAKEKHLTNIRASSSDIATILTKATILTLEQCIDFLEDDELLEVTPKSLRLRKKILDPTLRSRARNRISSN